MQASSLRTAAVICFTLGFFSQFAVPSLQAQTPTGTVFYQSNTMKAMRPDGTGKVQVLPEVSFGHVLFPSGADPTKPYALRGIPCDQVHGSDPFHDRWYLTWVQTNTYDEVYIPTGSPFLNYPHLDAFAYRTNPLNRSQVVAVQLTDLYGIFAPDPGILDWSNDTNESSLTSFISLSGGYDIRNSFSETTLSDGSSHTTFSSDESLSPYRSVRLPWTASYIQAQWLSGAPVPFRPTTPAQLDVCFYGWAGSSRLTSPNGTAFAAVRPDRILSIFDSYDRSITLKVLWNGTGAQEPKYPGNPVWSRDGLSVAFLNEGNSVYSSSGGVWSVPVASGAPRQLAKNVSKGFRLTRFSEPMWSTDSKFIVMKSTQQGSTGFATSNDLLRIPAGGGVAVNLTADTSEFVSGMRWVSNVRAPLAP